MPTAGHPGARARACPGMIGCCPDSHLQKTRSSCGAPHAKPRCSVTNMLETVHAPLSALCSHSGQRSTEKVPEMGGKAKKSSNWGKKGAGTCLALVLSPVVTRLLESHHASGSRRHRLTCLSVFISACRWSAQTHGDRRALRLQRQGGPPPLEPETLRSSRRGKIMLTSCPE